jgi:hypothetical protein
MFLLLSIVADNLRNANILLEWKREQTQKECIEGIKRVASYIIDTYRFSRCNKLAFAL